MEERLASTLAVLGAMITPAVLISACSSLILATSQRLSRVIARTRELSRDLVRSRSEPEAFPMGRDLLLAQLRRSAERAGLLQRAMNSLYTALAAFVAVSATIGVVAAVGYLAAWLPIPLGIVGVAFLSDASVLLVRESRVALVAVREEMSRALEIAREDKR